MPFGGISGFRRNVGFGFRLTTELYKVLALNSGYNSVGSSTGEALDKIESDKLDFGSVGADSS